MHKFKLKPKAIIFDMDGVIIDSMPYHFLAWYEALRPYGVRVSCFDVYSKEGEKWEKTLKGLLSKAKVPFSEKTLSDIFFKRQKIFKKYFKRFIFKGAYKFIGCLKSQGYSLGLVTGTPIAQVNKILPLRILNLFDAIVSGDQVKKGKPHPEPYIKCAKSLRLDSKECIVIENAPFGISSAKKAGMFCIALTTSLPQEYLRGADIVAEKLEDIAGIIEGSCALRPKS